jgi:hypothetical protein
MEYQKTDEGLKERLQTGSSEGNISGVKPLNLSDELVKHKRGTSIEGIFRRGDSLTPRQIFPYQNRLSSPQISQFSPLFGNAMETYDMEIEKKNMNRLALNPTTPLLIKENNLFKMISCPIITTFTNLYNNKKYSCLTYPISNIKHYYLISNKLITEFDAHKSLKFKYNEYEESMTNNKISKEKMFLFIKDLNQCIEPLEFELKEIQKEFDRGKNMFSLVIILSIILFILCVFSIFYDIKTEQFSFFYFSLFLTLSLLAIISSYYGFVNGFSKTRDILNQYAVYSKLISFHQVINEKINSWNKDEFIKQGIIAKASPFLNYINFCLDPYHEIVLRDHS